MELFILGPEAYSPHLPATAATFRTLSAFNRINALSCIKGAEHGWLGASFSCAELLTVLMCRAEAPSVVLSKGHAAAMQYACLAGLGLVPALKLRHYKDGLEGLPAHTDRVTPGIEQTSGSLGQALSKTLGMSMAAPSRRFVVILGDGELQEGQNWEAFQSLLRMKHGRVLPIVDSNLFQTERAVAEIKGITDLEMALRGLGLRVLSIDGHDGEAIEAAYLETQDAPTVVLARTVKAAGSALLAPREGKQPWHGQVPDDDLYVQLLEELVGKSHDAMVRASFNNWRARLERSRFKPATSSGLSTGAAFGEALRHHVEHHPALWVLDADLAHSCRLEPLAQHPRFLEVGIAEQDMVSMAGGLALSGALPVVNTYAAFLKRALEQVQVNALEETHIVYAGHYAGLCYHTDGKVHQSLNDLRLFASIPGMTVLEPVTPEQTRFFLDYALYECRGPVYLRLRRTPLQLELPEQPMRIDRPLLRGTDFAKCFVTCGTVSTQLALECLKEEPFRGFGVLVQGVLRGPCDGEFWTVLLSKVTDLIVLEEDTEPGVLSDWVLRRLVGCGARPRVLTKGISGAGSSFRTLSACRQHFGFTSDALREAWAGISAGLPTSC